MVESDGRLGEGSFIAGQLEDSGHIGYGWNMIPIGRGGMKVIFLHLYGHI